MWVMIMSIIFITNYLFIKSVFDQVWDRKDIDIFLEHSVDITIPILDWNLI